MDKTELAPDLGTVIADDYTIASEQSGLSADYVTTGSRWTDTGASSGGVTSSLGNSGGVVSWCVAGAGLTNQTGTSFFTGSTVDMGTFLPFDYQAVLRQAFDAWSAVANIEFIQVADGGGNLGAGDFPTIRVCGGFIDGQSGANVLARAFFPSSADAGGDVVFDSGNTSLFSSAQNFFMVALHEIGHTLGLDHEPSALAVMNATFNPSLTGLQTDDINGIRAVYGAQDFGANVYYMPTGQTSLTLIDNCPSLTVVGNGGGNTIVGSNGGETFRGAGGNDSIDGGGGTDYAVFSGVRSAYTITPLGGSNARVTGPDGTDTVTNVEWLVFNDQSISWPPPARVGYWAMNGANTLWHPIGDPSPALAVVGTGDFNGDGRDDILFRDNANGDTGYWSLLNDQPTWHYLGRNNTSYVVAGVGDFDGDRHSDILLRNNATGDTGFIIVVNDVTHYRPFGASSSAYTLLGVGDFNGDGTSDVLFQNPSTLDTGYWAVHNGVAIWANIGRSSSDYAFAGIGDFNADGYSDVMFRNNTTGDMGYWNMGAGPTFHYVGRSASGYAVVGFGDYNGDGTTDVLFRSSNTGYTGFWGVIPNGSAIWTGVGSASSAYSLATAESGDFNNDGRDDVLWRA